mmetsp:Transcript_50686/g.126181  ORF Transcript_50686/g.126181 Transcript_50686/m.126181 type:complete len:412 (+) Transcript_50686:182-1417(+)
MELGVTSRMQASLSLSPGGEQVVLAPVEGVSVTVHVDGVGKGFEVEWRDVRSLPSTSDADVSRNATPRAHTEALLSVQSLLRVVMKIVFGDESSSLALGACAAQAAAGGEADMVLLLQHRANRAMMQRVKICMDRNGGFEKGVVVDERLAEVSLDKTPLDLLKRLGSLLSPARGYVFAKPVQWVELPSELWFNVLRCMTKKEGRAVSCTSQMVQSIVTQPSFTWAPALLHLSLAAAADAVRLDTSTHLPVNISEKEVRIGRSRRNDVVLLRDPEVSKKHCRIWRDWRGDVYIQDLASTNGTKLNGEWLRPHADAGPDPKASSDPRKLTVGDVVVLGLTTLKLDDGPAPDLPPRSATGRAAGEGEDAAGSERPDSPTGSMQESDSPDRASRPQSSEEGAAGGAGGQATPGQS